VKRWLIILFLFLITYSLCLCHRAVYKVKTPDVSEEQIKRAGRWIPKEELGIHQLFLFGTPTERGLAAGRLTGKLIDLQETTLIEMLEKMVPGKPLLAGGALFLMRWFWGIDRFVEQWMGEEIWGVAQGTSHRYDKYADRVTRQLAYHGLHEVGQMATDIAMGCTVFAVPYQSSWMIGRNFDFEGGRIFDREKIMKWVFPDQGNAFLSVVWAGMVGAVTGVNEKGVYISINAAGSTDFRRFGTPSTLVLLKALQFSNTAEEARKIIESSTMFITDIFLIADKESVFYIEKSPDRFKTKKVDSRLIIANHLTDPHWQEDGINVFRREKLTSLSRFKRGESLLASLQDQDLKSSSGLTRKFLSFLRDKHAPDGTKLHLGNRSAIDALIATHAVIYDAKNALLYVAKGPGVTGAFLGIDLNASFRSREIKIISELPQDPEVTPERFHQINYSVQLVQQAEKAFKKKDCGGGGKALKETENIFVEHSAYSIALGDYYECLGDKVRARAAWEKAVSLRPPYASQREMLRKKLEQ
jgi:hypothetical protein